MGTARAQGSDSLKSKFFVDVFYGGPNLVTRVVDILNPVGGNESQSISSFGPIGVRADYMLGEIISLGLEVHRSSSFIRRTITEEAGGTSQIVFQDRIAINRTRVYPRLAAHFGKGKLDVYAQVGMGLAFWSSNYKLERKTSDAYDYVPPLKLKGGTLLAAFRSSLGFRYMFSRHIGFHGDLGLGGPFYTLGLSGRF
jgi:hypothetical protein